MTAEINSPDILVLPDFSKELIAPALQEMKEQPADEQKAELVIMNARNSSLAVLYQEQYLKALGSNGNRAKANQIGAGMLLGHRVVRYAFQKQPVPPRLLETIRGYAHIVAANPERLVSDVARDYADHESIASMLNEGFTFPDSRFGFRLVLAIYGSLANKDPDRPPMAIPPVYDTPLEKQPARVRPSRQYKQRHQRGNRFTGR
jgi:hypothetical protein